MRSKLICFSFLFILIFEPAFSWDGVLWRTLRPTKNLDMMVIDDFEEKVKWNLANSLPVASILRFAEINPTNRGLNNMGNDKNENLYRDEVNLLFESAKIQGRSFSKTQRFSQELLVYFANPGTDYQVIRVPEKDRHFIKGRPIAISLWVMGKGKRHTFYALFSNQVQDKIQVKMGDLDFYGWKRIEVPIPIYVAHRNRLNHNVYEFKFEGFKVLSNPAEQAGNFLFLYDLVSVLIDKTPQGYAGDKINDNWK